MALSTRSSSPLVRWDPFADLGDLNRGFDQIVRSLVGPGYAPARSTDRQRGGQAWRPLSDVVETESGYEVRIEVPGLKRDEISVDVENDILTVSGEYQETEEGETRRTLRSGRFEYRTQLPKGTAADEISAALADGVLTLVVPKVVKAEPRRVEITEG